MLEVTPTRSAYLELLDEREGMQEGYRFLDEKRLVLAAEILEELRRYDSALGQLRVAHGQAARALLEAVARHGLGGLEIYPPGAAPGEGRLQRRRRSVLGVELTDLHLERPRTASGAEEAVHPSPEAERCRELFARILPLAASVAGMAGNLERLRTEYEKTSRRARALEDVLLPEIDQALASIDTALEELDKEEAVRVRCSRPDPGR